MRLYDSCVKAASALQWTAKYTLIIDRFAEWICVQYHLYHEHKKSVRKEAVDERDIQIFCLYQ